MLCLICQSVDFESLAFTAINGNTNYLIEYHETVLGVLTACRNGCELCSLFWETWLARSNDWRWGDVWIDDTEEDILRQKQNPLFTAAILASPASFKPALQLDVVSIWRASKFSLEVENPTGDQVRGSDPLLRKVVRGVWFRIDEGEFVPAPNENSVRLEIQADTSK